MPRSIVLLLDAGAADVRNQAGETAKSIAARKQHDEAVAAFADWFEKHRKLQLFFVCFLSTILFFKPKPILK